MIRRITIMLDSKIELKLRKIQAKKLKKLNKSFSFSKTVNGVLIHGLKTYGKRN